MIVRTASRGGGPAPDTKCHTEREVGWRRAPAGETKKLLERLWIGKDQLPQGKGFASVVCHSSEPAATSGLFSALPGYFGFEAVREPLVIPADEVDTQREAARELGVAVGSR